MGIGFIIKYLVLFDFTAILLFFFLFEMIQPETRWKFKVWTRFIIAGLAFLIPFGLTNLYFWLGPNFKDFHFITYELPGNYGSNPSFLRYITMYLDFTAKFLPISFLVFYVALKKRKPWEVKYTWFFLMWIFSVLVAMYVPGKEFSHYTIQLMLPFSMVAGLFFHTEFENGRVMGFIFSRKYGLPVLGLFIIAIQIISFQNEVLKPDYEEEVSDYISKRIEKYDDVYVSNYQQIVYYLLEIESPSKYVHSNLMFTENQKAFDVKGEDEIKRIISKKPRFVIIQQNNKLVENLIKKDYHELKDFQNKRIKLYELIR
jgi:hypothetical protein